MTMVAHPVPENTLSRPLQDDAMTVREVAELLHVSGAYVRRLLDHGRLAGAKGAGRTDPWVISRAVVEQVTADRRSPPGTVGMASRATGSGEAAQTLFDVKAESGFRSTVEESATMSVPAVNEVPRAEPAGGEAAVRPARDPKLAMALTAALDANRALLGLVEALAAAAGVAGETAEQ